MSNFYRTTAWLTSSSVTAANCEDDNCQHCVDGTHAQYPEGAAMIDNTAVGNNAVLPYLLTTLSADELIVQTAYTAPLTWTWTLVAI